MNHQVEVNTARYEEAHGRKPRGKGCWTCHIVVDTHRGKYTANIVRMDEIRKIVKFIQAVYKSLNLSYEDRIILEILP